MLNYQRVIGDLVIDIYWMIFQQAFIIIIYNFGKWF
jgi:hypothetical protein